jgi:two-component system sensor histidine kinase NblS
VSDTGIGIAPEDQEAIFDRFFRVENRVHTLEGTGLGLSIVKNIIEKHNSQVHLISEVGIGTTFWFDLTSQPIDHIESLMAEMEAEAGHKPKTKAADAGEASALTPASRES